jgi:WhiB family transcriptional regulator, redox-sensing transcriptional regulator
VPYSLTLAETAQALCAQSDPEVWFPETGGSPHAAQAVCARCPIAARCFDVALTRNELTGIWGGTTPNQRRALRRRARTARPDTAASAA